MSSSYRMSMFKLSNWVFGALNRAAAEPLPISPPGDPTRPDDTITPKLEALIAQTNGPTKERS